MKALGWGLVGLLLTAGGFFFWNACRLEMVLSRPETQKGILLYTDSAFARAMPLEAAAGLAGIYSVRKAADLSLSLSFGAAGLAILCAVVMAATSRRRSQQDIAGCSACSGPIEPGRFLCERCGT